MPASKEAPMLKILAKKISAMDSTLHAHMDRLDAIDERFEKVDEKIEMMDSKLDKILETLNMARGGLKMLLSIGALAGAIGALVARFFNAGHS
jgi:archaellum component FlaC